jgi:hypothetical protein
MRDKISRKKGRWISPALPVAGAAVCVLVLAVASFTSSSDTVLLANGKINGKAIPHVTKHQILAASVHHMDAAEEIAMVKRPCHAPLSC